MNNLDLQKASITTIAGIIFQHEEYAASVMCQEAYDAFEEKIDECKKYFKKRIGFTNYEKFEAMLDDEDAVFDSSVDKGNCIEKFLSEL